MMNITAGAVRLWILHVVMNVFLILGIYAWLSIGDANGAQLAGTVIYGIAIAFLGLWLYDGTFVWFSNIPRRGLAISFARALRTLAPFTLMAGFALLIYWLLSRATDQIPDSAATAASWLTLKLRHPVKPATIARVLRWLVLLVEWFGAPLLLLPITASVASRGWLGFGRHRFDALRRRYLVECPTYLIIAFLVPYAITHWVPGVHGFTWQTVSAALRFAAAYLIFVTAWLALTLVTASRPRPD